MQKTILGWRRLQPQVAPAKHSRGSNNRQAWKSISLRCRRLRLQVTDGKWHCIWARRIWEAPTRRFDFPKCRTGARYSSMNWSGGSWDPGTEWAAGKGEGWQETRPSPLTHRSLSEFLSACDRDPRCPHLWRWHRKGPAFHGHLSGDTFSFTPHYVIQWVNYRILLPSRSTVLELVLCDALTKCPFHSGQIADRFKLDVSPCRTGKGRSGRMKTREEEGKQVTV